MSNNRYIENPSKGKAAMILGVIVGLLGIFTLTIELIVIGIIIFAIGKIINWYHNQ